jgi:hypothetical protein
LGCYSTIELANPTFSYLNAQPSERFLKGLRKVFPRRAKPERLAANETLRGMP